MATREDWERAGFAFQASKGKARVHVYFKKTGRLESDPPQPPAGKTYYAVLQSGRKESFDLAVKDTLNKYPPGFIDECLLRLDKQVKSNKGIQKAKLECTQEVKACFMAWYNGAAEGSNLRTNVKTWLGACSAWVSFDVVNVLFVFALLTL